MSDVRTLRELDTWPVQVTRGHKIPGSRYTSREFFAQEWEHMWTKVWLLLGRESQLPNPGDWQMEKVGPESILMVRQKDGGVKAFYNVCQHRGNPLVDDPKGSVKRFVCRYHSWAYLPDGTLNFAPDKEDFPEGDPCKHVRLEELACETFAGFVWVNMEKNCMSLKDYLGPIWDAWSQLDLGTWKRTIAKSAWVPCNWKVVLDNFNESYHVPTVHMAATPDTDRKKITSNINTYYKETRFDLSDEGHNRMVMQGGYGSGQTDKEGNIKEPLASSAARVGHRTRRTSRAVQKPRAPHCRMRSESSDRRAATDTIPTYRTSSSPTRSTTRCSRTSPCRYGPTVFTSCARGRITTIRSNACSTTGGTRARRRSSHREWVLGTQLEEGPEAEVTMIDHTTESIGPAIEDDLRVFLTQQTRIPLARLTRVCICRIRKSASAATTN